jgi:hypothetical protein
MRSCKQQKMNLVGTQVRQVRLTLDERVSQEELAARCQRAGWGISREIVAKIEGGTRKVSDQEVKHLAGVLGVTVARLFGE